MSERKTEILRQCDHVPLGSAGSTQAFKLTCAEVNSKCVFVIRLVPTIGTILELQLIATLLIFNVLFLPEASGVVRVKFVNVQS